MRDEGTPAPIRVSIPHPALPEYRVPVFRELNRRSGIKIRVLYGQSRDLPNVEAAGFEAEYAPLREGHLLGQTVYWHAAQLQAADPAQCDVLLLDWNARYGSLAPALLRARSRRVGTVLWGHGRSKHEAAWRNWGRQAVARLATALVFYDPLTAARFTERYHWEAARVFVAPNALDQQPIQAARQHWLKRPQELTAFRHAQGLEGSAVILFVSRLDANRRADLLLQAAALLKDQRRLVVAIIGAGPEQAALKSLADSLGLAANVRFPGAIYDPMQLAPWYLSSDVMCFPADMGLSLLQAFGYGLPVVSAGAPEQHGPEIAALRDGENGILCPQVNAQEIADALKRILTDAPLRKRMSQAALQTATRDYSLGAMVDGLEAAIRFAAAQYQGQNERH